MTYVRYCAGALFVSLTACGGGEGAPAASRPAADPPGASAPAASSPAASRPAILIIGTSLTAGYGLDPALAWPAVLQRRVDSAGLSYRVVNAGVSGETSAGALRRADWVLQRERPAVLILETGGNDGLRGQHPDSLRANILALFERARRLDPALRLVLMQMEAPPNLGDDYTRRFRAVYPAAAAAAGATLVPFFLAEVAGIDSLNLPDGIHPTPRGHEIAAAFAWRYLEPLLR